MGLFRKFFYKKPPEGLLEISERVYGELFLVDVSGCIVWWVSLLGASFQFILDCWLSMD